MEEAKRPPLFLCTLRYHPPPPRRRHRRFSSSSLSPFIPSVQAVGPLLSAPIDWPPDLVVVGFSPEAGRPHPQTFGSLLLLLRSLAPAARRPQSGLSSYPATRFFTFSPHFTFILATVFRRYCAAEPNRVGPTNTIDRVGKVTAAWNRSLSNASVHSLY